ncbi:AAA family ATPase [Streptomyces sp. NPDC018019]|uniref:AAA family ATPase n=1 Tax=Streptomyces sp. NPDC018019 TaxID=3365030 RepID=UPI00378B3668
MEGRLQAARQRAFAGRKQELAAFEEAPGTGGRVLFLHGPGGIGKSALLGRFAQRAAAADRASRISRATSRRAFRRWTHILSGSCSYLALSDPGAVSIRCIRDAAIPKHPSEPKAVASRYASLSVTGGAMLPRRRSAFWMSSIGSSSDGIPQLANSSTS